MSNKFEGGKNGDEQFPTVNVQEVTDEQINELIQENKPKGVNLGGTHSKSARIAQMLKVIAFANTFAIIDLILHPLFHLWISVAPRSYEWAMNLFVAGLHLQITDFDSSFIHIALGTVVEALVFWLLGASFALIYNRLSKSQN